MWFIDLSIALSGSPNTKLAHGTKITWQQMRRTVQKSAAIVHDEHFIARLPSGTYVTRNKHKMTVWSKGLLVSVTWQWVLMVVHTASVIAMRTSWVAAFSSRWSTRIHTQDWPQQQSRTVAILQLPSWRSCFLLHLCSHTRFVTTVTIIVRAEQTHPSASTRHVKNLFFFVIIFSRFLFRYMHRYQTVNCNCTMKKGFY
jgi:hypothetical protein